MLIVLDGLDSSGKKTQSDLLIKRLKSKGVKTGFFDFPRYESFYGKLIARYLKGEFGDVYDVSPYLASLLYALDRQGAGDLLIKWLKEGRIIILNRYVSSNKAFQAAKLKDKEKRQFYDWLEELEYKKNLLPKEDILFYLDVPIEISQKWLSTKGYRKYMGNAEKDIHEKNTDYLRKVEKLYLELVEKHENYHRIACVKDNRALNPEEINEKIWTYLDKVI
tara:strand:+ start:8963 stop:9625 length:663 start_codon:yes stop_codon:yes gene_type:complete